MEEQEPADHMPCVPQRRGLVLCTFIGIFSARLAAHVVIVLRELSSHMATIVYRVELRVRVEVRFAERLAVAFQNTDLLLISFVNNISCLYIEHVLLTFASFAHSSYRYPRSSAYRLVSR